ncbi:MAG: PD40 domain-containing protein [Planctomycetes bacterium]|nr:PD40 domain-containing protein [Planctomycetota bacterium]
MRSCVTFPALLASFASLAFAQTPLGYYRQPSIHGDDIVFVSEGDLWKVSADKAKSGAVATRLTTHAGDESTPRISPDGKSVAFTAQYEGPTEVYVMPMAGGLPKRLTWDAARTTVAGWKAGDSPRIIAATNRFTTLPTMQLTLIDPASGERELLPLAQAADGCFDDSGNTLFFTRLAFQNSQTKRYKGGTAQQLWSFAKGAAEATHLAPDFPGTNAYPMWWQSRVYFLSDRDGTMEVWSMTPDGKDLKQTTNHSATGTELLDVKGASLDSGRIVYQLGADLWLYDIAANADTKLSITLDSDFDQTRERWVKKPMDYLSAAHISADGEHVALTARGRVFVAPKQQGRLVDVTRTESVRYRDARFMPDGKSLVALSDASGEVELCTLPSNGVGDPAPLTTDGVVLRWQGIPSPDGNYIAHHDKNQKLWIFDTRAKTNKLIDENAWENFSDLRWSADSRWLAFVAQADNLNPRVRLYNVETGSLTNITTDRYVSTSPAFSTDGKWLFFLSDRHLRSIVGSPWGYMAPEPFFDNKTKVFAVSLKPGARWPYQQDDELYNPKADKKDDKKKEDAKDDAKKPDAAPKDEKKEPDAPDSKDAKPDKKKDDAKDDKKKIDPIEIDLDGIADRLYEVPCPPGNYSDLNVTDKRLLMLSNPSAPDAKNSIVVYPIANKDLELKTLVPDVKSYEMSGDGKSLLVQKGEALHIIESGASAPASLDKTAVPLAGWSFSLTPRQEWRQMFIESWRLERDYFYDTNMHGTDWKALLNRYLPLVDRVATRAELSDLIAQMVAELSALHTFVRGGDLRTADTDATPASLGALLTRDVANGGYRVDVIFESDPDEPDKASPLSRPGVDVRVGDIIQEINGVGVLTVADPAVLLRNQSGKQVLLKVKPKAGGDARNVIAVPFSPAADSELRYHNWEYTRRKAVEQAGNGDIGYVHLRAMGNENWTEFAKGFYSVFNRKGLIIDVRANRGGNIDSWLLSRLLRKAWFYWQPRVGKQTWNMQYAFRGHIAVLCNEFTASDGEAFTEGVKRLGIGRVFGTRTWGGEVWLSSSNFLVDGGIATASEIGVYGPDGIWLIEGHGAEPDVVVDNLPHATFTGQDAQLNAAIEYLKKEIKDKPVDVPPMPKHPDKSFKPTK